MFTPILKETLNTNPNTDTVGNVRAEHQARITRLLADGKRTPHQPAVAEHQNQHPDKAKFLADNGKNKVRMRFGQVETFFQTCTQAFAKPAAASNRHQGMRQLIAFTQRSLQGSKNAATRAIR